MTGRWFSLAAERDGQMTEITSRKYSGINPDGTLARMVIRHSYETVTDEWGEECEEIADTWHEPGLEFHSVLPGIHDLFLAVSSEAAGAPTFHPLDIRVALSGVGDLAISLPSADPTAVPLRYSSKTTKSEVSQKELNTR